MTIRDLYYNKVLVTDFSPEPSLAFTEGFELGADAVLEELEKRLSERHFTSAAFIQMDIEDFIKELKGE